MELDELERRLEEESMEVISRIEGENRQKAQFEARKQELDQERDARIARARQELLVVNEKLESALEVKAEFAGRLKDVEGELEYVRSKQVMGVEMRAEMEVTKLRFEEVLKEVNDQIEIIKAGVESELDKVISCLHVQEKTIYGLEGF